MQKNLQATKTHCLAAVFVDHYWQLPIWSVDLFTNTLRNLDQYCDLDFTRHYIYVKDDRLMRVDFNCNIEKCQLHGTTLIVTHVSSFLFPYQKIQEKKER